MNEMSFSEIQDFLNEVKYEELPQLNISILRNITVEPIELYIKYLAYQMSYQGNLKFGDYDNIFQEAVGENKYLMDENTDCVMVFSKLEVLSWDLARNYPALSSDRIKEELERIKEFINGVLSGVRNQTDAMILWANFERSLFPAFGIFDAQSGDGQNFIIDELNKYLRKSLQHQKNAYIVDLNLCLAMLGYNGFYDNRYWHIGRAPYSRDALRQIAIEIFKYIRSLKGKNKKCLVLDCDNVLWGGIIGEDELSGIQIGKAYPGSCFSEFQQEILNLYNRGIIIALCSKNNEDDVWEVFHKHPDMVLKEEHIATFQINWDDKITNLKKIALDLNIGLDSFVMVDDSDFEINLIKEALPEIEVIYAAKNKAVEFRDILASCGWFDTLNITGEDKKRGSLYKSEVNRKQLQEHSIDLNAYYKSLEMKLDIRFANEIAIPRIAQLTQKTNQLNLTNKRYSEADILSLVEGNSSDVLYLRLKDRFGDTGIVGVCILKYEDKKALIDTFLLSCRVIGRGAEDAFLTNALKLAKIRECEDAIGEYYATRKNTQVIDFYEKQGFAIIKDPSKQADKVYFYHLTSTFKSEPDYFAEINSEIIEEVKV